jgi:hypothetical protein
MQGSPFPGMDPYLEAPSFWPSVHARLINTISDMLTRQVAPRFIVTIEERVTITEPGDPLFREHAAPDVYLVQPPQPFLRGQTLEELIAEQQPPVVSDIDALAADFWPEDESADDINAYVEAQRRAEHIRPL